MKEKFYDDLQAVISSVPSSDVLLAMGDFNTRLCCVDNCTSEPLLDGVQGILVLAKSTRVVSHCLPFCSMNQLRVINAVFEKKEDTTVYLSAPWYQELALH